MIMERKYYIKSNDKYWQNGGYGYTDQQDEAGVFCLSEMTKFNLDGCMLIAADQPEPTLKKLNRFKP